MPLTFDISGVPTVHYQHGPNVVVKKGTQYLEPADTGTVGTARDQDTGTALVARDNTGGVTAIEVTPSGLHNIVWLPAVIALGDFGGDNELVKMVSADVADLVQSVEAAKVASEQAQASAAASAIDASSALALVQAGGGGVDQGTLDLRTAEILARFNGIARRVNNDPTTGLYPMSGRETGEIIMWRGADDPRYQVGLDYVEGDEWFDLVTN